MRDASTYRVARRNRCRRERGVWGAAYYYDQHKGAVRAVGYQARQTRVPISFDSGMMSLLAAPLMLMRRTRGIW